nr:ABC-2 type transporter [uncultured bacterium]
MAELVFTKKPKALLVINDSLIMIKRSSTHIIRNTDQLLGTFFQPIMFLLLFSAVFGGAIGLALPNGVSYLSYLMAGIIIQTAAFGSTTTALAVANDLQRGIIDRFRSSPMSSSALLMGHVVSDVFKNAISTIIMLLVGLLIGFRTSASLIDWLTIAVILILFSLAFSWLAAIMGVVAKSVEAVQWLTFVIIFPLTFASSAFTPTSVLNNAVLKAFAENQPITHVINAVRALLLGTPTGNSVWLAIVWSLGTLIVAIPLASWIFRNKTSH